MVMIKIDLTGDYKTEIYDLARKALAEGVDPEDRIEVWRNNSPAIYGKIGILSKLTVSETNRSGPRVVKWHPWGGIGSEKLHQ